jgi:Holliday junction resolvase RusA-like endonuclease
MTGAMHFTIPGRPKAWERAGADGKRRFTPKAMAEQEALIGQLAMVAGLHRNRFPAGQPVRLDVVAYFRIPASATKLEREALAGTLYVFAPDMDNLVKLVGDAMNRISYDDDRQIAVGLVVKAYGDTDCMVVRVGPASVHDSAVAELLRIPT